MPPSPPAADLTDPPAGFDFAGYAAVGFAFFVLAAQNSLARWAVGHGMTAADLVAIRFCIPGLFWLPYFVRRVRAGALPARRAAAFAVTAGVPYGLVLTSGYTFAPATHGAVLVPSATMSGGVLLSAILAGQPVGRMTAAVVAVALAGMAVVSGFWLERTGGTLPGDLLFVLAGVFWAGHIVSVGVWRTRAGDVIASVMALSLLYLPVYLATAEMPGRLWRGEGPPWPVVAAAAGFLAVLHSSLALPAYAWATARLTPMRVSLMTPVVPLLGVAVAIVTLGETLDPHEATGAVLVLAALAISARTKVRRAAAEPAAQTA